MNDAIITALKINAKKYIESYEAIQTLKRNAVLDDDFYQELRNDLLDGIIGYFESVVE